MPFQFRRLALPDILLVEARIIKDDRGFFQEMFKASAYAANGAPAVFVQDNHSRSQRGVLRGLHYQLEPQAQGKLVMAVRGAIFDVAVDIRRGSPTFGRWVGEELSDQNGRQLYVPPGFAHGFCVLSEEVDIWYKTTSEYAASAERGLRWNDPAVGVAWPVAAPSLSPKDAQMPLLADIETNFVYTP